MDWILSSEGWLAFSTLTLLEVVLGIDNIVFISILASKLPHKDQGKARLVGLTLAMLARILLLFCISLIMGLTEPLFSVFKYSISGRDLILLAGGLFLLGKATVEIHEKLEGEENKSSKKARATFVSVIIQILLLDLVFSIDSVITAVGMASELSIMIAAVVVAVSIMLMLAGKVNHFISQHPTVKMLALSFLLLIGVMLIGEGLGHHIPKGYLYFAMTFSIFVEVLNIRIRKPKQKPVQLREPY